jgi:hypothetical protein
MFHSNPFLDATEQFAEAALAEFVACDSVLSQQTDGQTTVTVTVLPTIPPSPYGLLTIEFTYDAGDAALLRVARELEEDTSDLGKVPALSVTRTYHIAASLDEDAEDVAERLWERVCNIPSVGADSDVTVDRINRRMGGGGSGLSFHAAELVVTIFELYTVTDVHARDWAALARECAVLVADLSEIATGKRPQRDLGPLAL